MLDRDGKQSTAVDIALAAAVLVVASIGYLELRALGASPLLSLAFAAAFVAVIAGGVISKKLSNRRADARAGSEFQPAPAPTTTTARER